MSTTIQDRTLQMVQRPARPLSPGAKLQLSTDIDYLTQKKKQSARLREKERDQQSLLNTLAPLIIPSDSDNSICNNDPMQIATVKDLVMSRKRKWNLKQESEELYNRQLANYDYLKTRAVQLKQECLDLQASQDKLLATQAKAAEQISTLHREHMTPDELQLDTELTQVEFEYAELYYKYKNAMDEHKKFSQQFEDNYDLLRCKKDEYLEINNEIQKKRRRLDKAGSVTTMELENYILSVIVEQKDKYQGQIKTIESKYEPFHCALCTDTIATCTFPCCFKGACVTCATKVIENGEIKCPYCRKVNRAEDLVKMQF